MDTTVETSPIPTVEPAFKQVEGLPPQLVGPINWDHPCSAHVTVLDAEKGTVAPADGRKRKKVCIVGYAENSRHLAWWDDPDCEIWGVNQLYRFIPRADRWFQIHRDWNDKSKWAQDTDQAAWIRQAPIPTYMIRHDPSLPNSVTYPVEWVKEQLGLAGDKDLPGTGLDYFTSTIAFMYALAIAEGFEQIGIYGIDLIIGREYFFEKACVEFYMGIAHAKGIGIHKPTNCALLWQSHRYGYEPGPDYGFFGLDKLKKRAAELSKQVAKLRDEVMRLDGRVHEAELNLGRVHESDRPDCEKYLGQLRFTLDQKLNEMYLHDGAFQETNRMYTLLELKSRGGDISEEHA